jgi:hypothetical protein
MKNNVLFVAMSAILALFCILFLALTDVKHAQSQSQIKSKGVEQIVIDMPQTRFDDEADMANPRGEDELAFGRLVEEANRQAVKSAAYPQE